MEDEPTWRSEARIGKANRGEIHAVSPFVHKVLENKKWVGTTHACETRDGQQNTPKNVNHKRLKRAERALERKEKSAAV